MPVRCSPFLCTGGGSRFVSATPRPLTTVTLTVFITGSAGYLLKMHSQSSDCAVVRPSYVSVLAWLGEFTESFSGPSDDTLYLLVLRLAR